MTLEEEGTRHNMMRNIAVYSRCHGMSESDCRKQLLEWYEAQDKTVVHSTDTEVLEDINGIIAWVYSDRFTVNYAYPKGEVLVNETNMRLVLAQRSRCARRVVFLLLVRCMAGHYKINYPSIAGAIGVSKKTTMKTILRLERDGILEIERGQRFSLGDGEFAAESNSYTVPHERGRKDERQYVIKIRDLMRDVTKSYFDALSKLFPVWQIRKSLLRTEQVEYEAYLSQEGRLLFESDIVAH